MKSKNIIIFLLWGSFSIASAHNVPLTILFSGSANGLLTSCHCPNNPWGGLAKRAWLINALQKTAGTDHVLTLDSGDLFPADPDPEREVLLLKLLGQMSYQAGVIGDQELAGGLDPWVKANREADLWAKSNGGSSFPWLSGGYQLEPRGCQKPFPFPAWAVVDRCGMRIGIVSVSHSAVWGLSKPLPKGVCLVPPSINIKSFIEATSGQLDLAIVLSHQDIEADRLLASQSKGIDLIIGGHSQSLLSPPEVVNGVIICQAGKNGENVGVLLLKQHSDIVSTEIRNTPHAVQTQTVSENPFTPTVTEAGRWHIAQQIIPLTDAVDDAESAATLINAFYKKADEQHAARVSIPDPQSKTNTPHLVLSIPLQPIALTDGQQKEICVGIGNNGNKPLKIERVRSRSPWLHLLEAPVTIEPFSEKALRFQLTTAKIDRFFRCDFSVSANDPLRPVVQCSFPGYVTGPRQGLLNPPALWSNLCEHLNGKVSAPLKPAPVPLPLPHSMQPSTSTTADVERRVKVDFFFAPGCSDCEAIEREILPKLTTRFEGLLDLIKRDVTDAENYTLFNRMSERLHLHPDTTVSVFVDEIIPLLGIESIRTKLERVVEERLNDKHKQL